MFLRQEIGGFLGQNTPSRAGPDSEGPMEELSGDDELTEG
jgi:hypothetical protein